MSDWCYNTITFESDDDLTALFNIISDEDNSINFDNIIPEPTTLESNERTFWRIKNWGTKWASKPERFEQRIEFATANTPPLGIYRKLVEILPDVKFVVTFSEQAAGISGRFTATGDGECFEEWETN